MTQLRVSQHPAKKITPMDVSINCAAPGNRQLILKWSLYKVERFAMHEDTYGMLAVRSPQGGLTYPRCCN